MVPVDVAHVGWALTLAVGAAGVTNIAALLKEPDATEVQLPNFEVTV